MTQRLGDRTKREALVGLDGIHKERLEFLRDIEGKLGAESKADAREASGKAVRHAPAGTAMRSPATSRMKKLLITCIAHLTLYYLQITWICVLALLLPVAFSV